MKITKEYLRTVIKEELERMDEGAAATENDQNIINILKQRVQQGGGRPQTIDYVKQYIVANFNAISPQLAKDMEDGRLGPVIRKAYADALNARQSGGVKDAQFYKKNLESGKYKENPIMQRIGNQVQKKYNDAISDIGAPKKQVR